jgi:lipid-A-disaccharide synthase
MKIFFSVGEPSGDLHGANLVRALREKYPDVECVGYGGPRMAAEGFELQFDLTQLAVMLLSRVLWNIRTFLSLIRQANRYFSQEPVDAVILIDYPGMNWWIARQARKHDIPVFYYGVPQIWAWAGWRIRKMRRLVNYALCKLPFEAPWYEERGCAATYVGHPYFDQLAEQVLDTAFMESLAVDGKRLVTILPGSRKQEIANQLPGLLKAAELVTRQVSEVRFVVASLNEEQAELARTVAGDTGLDLQIVAGRTQELIQQAYCCLACSGSVSLELMYYQVPSVILYRVGRVIYTVGRYLANVNYITLVNLMAAEKPFQDSSDAKQGPGVYADQNIPFPEYLTRHDCSRQLADHVIGWLEDESSHASKRLQLGELKEKFAHPGATERAAEFILARLEDRQRDRQASRAA